MLKSVVPFLCWALLMTGITEGDETKKESRPKFVIAIHGGAGGNPSRWNDDKRAARLAGLNHALEVGRDLLRDGGQAIDAVEAAIRVLEDDAAFNAGRGAVVTVDGKAELDASIMDGRDGSCGAVAGVTNAKNPISLARRVMSETKHVLLAGPGANQFAIDQKVPLVEPEYFLSFHRPDRDPDGEQPHFGTVGCVVLDTHGNLAAGTSTGGTPKKLAGRVGDSPIVGAGTYAANDSCAVSGTGVGEEYIRNAVAYDIAAQMRYAGRSLEASVTEIMTNRLQPGVGGVIAISRLGEIAMQHNTPGMSCAVADSEGRFETHLSLEGGGTPKPAETARQKIEKLLNRQVDDWNAGDIEGFMTPYWRSEDLTFASGGEVTRGWDATIRRYKSRYSTREQMGKLEFSQLEFRSLGVESMQVLGAWKLTRDEPIDGRFSLTFRRLRDGWKIVHDHTSLSRDR